MRWCKSQPLVSLLVPFREGNDPQRTRIWEWLEKFYSNPEFNFEVVVGTDDGVIFSKSTAVNNAALKARGKVFVILDADCYTNPAVIIRCAETIASAEEDNRSLWFVPYLTLYRLTKEKTSELLENDPPYEYDVPHPAPDDWLEPGRADQYGHKFGAMILIMSSKAFWMAGGMDPRFRGWGSEDMSFMLALDTLYGLHETVDNGIYHLWHARPKTIATRHWDGQRVYNMNARLGQRYGLARGDQTFMKALIDEHYNPRWWNRLWRWMKQRFYCVKGFLWRR